MKTNKNSNFYKSKVVENYERLRKKDRYWSWENDFLKSFLAKSKNLNSIIDIPIGTGRFLEFYKKYTFDIYGVDISADMLKKTKEKILKYNLEKRVTLKKHNISSNDFIMSNAKVTICFRLFHLLKKSEIKIVIENFAKFTDEKIILQVFDVRDFNIISIFKRILASVLNTNVNFYIKIKYLFKTFLFIIKSHLMTSSKQQKNHHKKDTFSNITYSHDINEIIKTFRDNDFIKLRQEDLIDKDHLLGETGLNFSTIIVFEKRH